MEFGIYLVPRFAELVLGIWDFFPWAFSAVIFLREELFQCLQAGFEVFLEVGFQGVDGLEIFPPQAGKDAGKVNLSEAEG